MGRCRWEGQNFPPLKEVQRLEEEKDEEEEEEEEYTDHNRRTKRQGVIG